MVQRRSLPSPLSQILAALALLATSRAEAAGYYSFELSPKSIGRAGAVVVNPEDPSALWLNPAAITQVRGFQLRIDGAAVLFQGRFVRDCGPNDDCGPKAYSRDYGSGRVASVTEERSPSDDEYVLDPARGNLGRLRTPSDFSDGHAVANQAGAQGIPGIFAVWNLAKADEAGLALGLAFYAPYAGDYAYGADEYTRYSLIDRDLLEAYYQATLAYQIAPWLALGGSVQGVSAGVRQQVKLSADRYGNESPDADIHIELNTLAHFIPSANFGVWAAPLPGLEFGASLQLGRDVRASGPLRIVGVGSEIQELIDSGAVTLEEQDPSATVSFRMPAFLRAGVKYGQRDVWDGLFDYEVELDVVMEQWSVYDHVFLETRGVTFAQGAEPAPLEPIVQARDWQDAWSARLGGELWFLERQLSLRGGVMYESSAVPSTSLNVELMDGDKVIFGAGLSYRLAFVQLDLGYGHAWIFDRVVGDESLIHLENPVRTFHTEPRTRVAMGRYQMSHDVLSAGLTFRFE